MANDRNRYGNRDSGWDDREDDGYIARRGFGNRSAGYDRRPDKGRGRERERDFGDSAGYGTGGSALD